jgi:hypothetical protein
VATICYVIGGAYAKELLETISGSQVVGTPMAGETALDTGERIA